MEVYLIPWRDKDEETELAADVSALMELLHLPSFTLHNSTRKFIKDKIKL